MSVESFPQQPEAVSLPPFSEFIFKVARDCNMQPRHELDRDPIATIHTGCDHCYVYTQSTAWQQEPAFMEQSVIEQAAWRIAEHAAAHKLPDVRLVMHGGEPLLALREDPDYYTRMAETMRKYIDLTGANTRLSIQTNGLLLNERQGPAIIDQLTESGYTIGLSLDGPQIANDLHRRDKAGRSTHSRAERAARLLQDAGVDWKVLGVIDPRTNPEEVLEYLASLGPKSINLFPLHAHNSRPPIQHLGALSLGEWQKRAFDRYNNWSDHHPDTDGPPFEMPIYDNYLTMAFGGYSLNDTAGDRITRELFVTASGGIRGLDTLESSADGASDTGLNIFNHSIDQARLDPGIVARRMGFSALSTVCQNCDVVSLCFGGHYPNRYKAPDEPLTKESGVADRVKAFAHPNVYCEDHRTFLGSVTDLVRSIPIEALVSELPALPKEMAVNPDYAYRDFWAEAEAGQSIRVAALAEIIPRPEELVRVCSAYKNTSTISEPREYRMVPEEARHVRRAIENQQLTGREALHAAHMVAQQYEGAIDYSGHAAYGSIAVPYVKDYNDAIVHALYNALPESLGQGSQSAIAKGGRYWFATREVVDAFVADRHTPHVVTACWSSDSRLNFRYDAIPVTTFDLPRDLFIVDAVAAGRQEVLAALREVAGRMSACQNPKRLADTLTDSSIRIMPFAGEWDTAYDQKEWASYPTLPQPLPPDDVAKNKYVRMREEDMFSAARRT